jgi:hypothetical protein
VKPLERIPVEALPRAWFQRAPVDVEVKECEHGIIDLG